MCAVEQLLTESDHYQSLSRLTPDTEPSLAAYHLNALIQELRAVEAWPDTTTTVRIILSVKSLAAVYLARR